MQWASIGHGNGFSELDDLSHIRRDFKNLLTTNPLNLHSTLFISSLYLHLLLLSTAPLLKSLDYPFLSSTQSACSPETLSILASTYTYDLPTHTLVYKLVAKKICPVIGPLDEEFQITQTLLDDPIAGLKPLPINLPDFMPRSCFTQECTDSLDLDLANWLWPEEVKLV